jgi:hypothetical protein
MSTINKTSEKEKNEISQTNEYNSVPHKKNESYNTKSLTALNKSNYNNILKRRKLPYLNRNKNYFNNDNKKKKAATPFSNKIQLNSIFDRNEKEKEKLIMEINQSNNELRCQDKEIKLIQNLYGTIRQENLANHYLLNKLLNKDKSANISVDKNNKTETEKEIMRVNNDNSQKEDYSNSKNNDKISEIKDDKNSNSNADNQSIFLTGTNISDKNSINNNCISLKMKKNRTFVCNEQKNWKESNKFKLLMRELKFYDKALKDDIEKIQKLKENKKVLGYLQAQANLDKKNKELEDLIKISNELQQKINEQDMIMYLYKIKNDNYISLINSIKKKIKDKYKPNYINLEKRLKKLESQKETLEKNSNLYKSEIDRIKEENENEKKKEEQLKKEIDDNKKILDEKDRNNTELTQSFNNEQRLKQKIDLKIKKIEQMKEINNELNQLINKTEEEKKNKLIQFEKDEKIQQEKIQKILKEIKDINIEMQKYSYKKEVESSIMESEMNKNEEIINEQKSDIEYLKNNEKNILNEINKLNKELEAISKDSKNQKEELQILKKNIKNKQNIKLKEENENLVQLFNEKKKELDDAIQKSSKLKNKLIK